MKSIYIYGASGHGLVVADIALACGYDKVIFIDDGDNYFINFESIKNRDIPIALAIGSNRIRSKIFNKLKDNNFDIVNLIHPSAIISKSAILGIGIVIMPNVVVNAKVTIGNGVILNSASVIEHECIIDSFAHISPNVALAGDVKVGSNSHIGIGSSIIQGIDIGNNVIIGAGSVVVKNINNLKKAYGNPCMEVEDINE